MEWVSTVQQVRKAVGEARARGRSVGLVPTMGALHEGHLSLVRAARAETDYVVVSIFVNPTQFGPGEDLGRYPRRLDEDGRLCREQGVDLIFHPRTEDMYGPDHRTFVEVAALGDKLCGAARPGHFRGVTTVVIKLLNIVAPDRAYFGQKDAQQARILTKMVEDLDLPVAVVVLPIVREADGLAMSSRNAYLEPDQRRQAVVLHEALQSARREIEAGERSAQRVQTLIEQRIAAAPDARVDYVAVVDPESLDPVESLHGRVLVALAVHVGPARLIDNMLVDVGGDT